MSEHLGHYGEPLREQRALADGRGRVPRTDLTVVTVSGSDRLAWLHSLTTAHLDGLAPGASTETLVLSPTGHIEHAMAVLDDGTTTHLIIDRADDTLAGWLESMRFRKDVRVEDRRDLAVIEWTGSVQSGALTWTDPWPTVADGGTSYYAGDDDSHPVYPRMWSIVPLSIAHGWDSQGSFSPGEHAWLFDHAVPAGLWAAEALRIEALRPRFVTEVDHRTLPAELDWLRTAVHLSKGCYRGQESVARVYNVGRPPRRLTFLHLDGSGHVLPQRGADVIADDKVAGTVTSVALHHELGPIGLAVVSRTMTGAELRIVDGQVEVTAVEEPIVVPSGDAKDRPVIQRPDLPRLRARRR